jgi:nucleoside-diphosphate-sugar epimerase
LAGELTARSVLLTGATGFLGRLLLRRLLEGGARVCALGRNEPDRGALPPGAALTFFRCDLADAAAIAALAPRWQGVQAVLHSGGFVLRSSHPENDDPIEAMRVNAVGTAQLLKSLPETVSSLCYVSTIDVYGVPREIPLSEDAATRPTTCYAASKLAGEALTAAWAARRAIPASVLRLSQVYGPADNSRKAVPNFIRAVLRGQTPCLNGDGSDIRDYVYADDAAEGILQALARRASGVFNISGGDPRPIRDTLEIILRLAGSGAIPATRPGSSPPVNLAPDISRARRELGYAPRVALEEGLRRTIAWFREHPEA